jgi:hypothetical protein
MNPATNALMTYGRLTAPLTKACHCKEVMSAMMRLLTVASIRAANGGRIVASHLQKVMPELTSVYIT